MTILALFQSAKPGASLWVKTAINVYIPYWSLGIANNVFMTLLIVLRMLVMRKKISRVLNAKDLGVYLSISAMLIESAALYSLFGIVYIILFARNSPVQFPINGILDQVAVSYSDQLFFILDHLMAFHSALRRSSSLCASFSAGRGHERHRLC